MTAPTPRRRPGPPAAWERVARRVSLALLVAAPLVGAGWLTYSAGPGFIAGLAGDVALRLSAQAGLTVEEITVEGRDRTAAEDLIGALGVARGEPILAVDLPAARARVQSLAWVRDAALERRLPDLIHLSITERQPIALWQSQGRFMLVDTDGTPFAEDISAWNHLPLLVGEDAPAQAAELIAVIEEAPELAARVKAAVRVSGRRWNVLLDRIDGGIELRLPEEDPAGAWRRLADIDARQNLLDRRVTMVDLRLPDRLVIATPDSDPAAASARPKSRTVPGKDA